MDEFPHVFLGDGSARPVTDAPDLDGHLDRFDPDAVFIYGYSQRFQRRARAWALQHRRKILYYADSELRHARSAPRRAIKRLALPSYFAPIDIFATVGDANEAFYQSYGVSAQRFVRVPFPIDIDSYTRARTNALALRKAVRAQHGIAPDDFMISMAGKFVPWKRQADLIRMLDRLQDSVRRLVVVLIGTGPDEDTLCALAESQTRHRIVLSGFVQPADLPGYYAASDTYAHVAERDAHPIAVSEAVYMGCPVVLSDRCGSFGPTDDVQVGRNGMVYPCGDTRALAAHVRHLSENEGLRARMSVASREHGTRSQQKSHIEGLTVALQAMNLDVG